MTLYAYIMTHDTGGSPNPDDDICTLAYCMEMTRSVAGRDDYVVGLAGEAFRMSRWNIIYAMRVSEHLSPDKYCEVFSGRTPKDEEEQVTLRFGALVSKDFVYWGNRAQPIPPSLGFLWRAFYNSNGRLCPVGHKNSFTSTEVQAFKSWFNKQRKGKQGEPFGTVADEDKRPRTSHRRHRKKC